MDGGFCRVDWQGDLEEPLHMLRLSGFQAMDIRRLELEDKWSRLIQEEEANVESA